jgi:hypothetical protein
MAGLDPAIQIFLRHHWMAGSAAGHEGARML